MAFFRKGNEPEGAAARALPPAQKESRMGMLRREEPPASGELNAVLGRGSSFEGKLTFEGTVRIEGAFTGEIHTNDTLVIGDGAKVQGEIHAGTIVVSGGDVVGNLHAKVAIELERSARVRGTLETPALKVDKGVIFIGSCRMDLPGEPTITMLGASRS